MLSKRTELMQAEICMHGRRLIIRQGGSLQDAHPDQTLQALVLAQGTPAQPPPGCPASWMELPALGWSDHCRWWRAGPAEQICISKAWLFHCTTAMSRQLQS